MYLRDINRSAARKIPVQVANGSNGPDRLAVPSSGAASFEARRDEVTLPETSQSTEWQATAQRLQAEMENFRKRQQRRADEAIAGERERLLSLFLPVADNLARALSQEQEQDESLRQGVKLIYRELMRALETEGVTRLATLGQPFSPDLHEAVATVPTLAEPDTIVEEIEPGYKLGDRLLRPARVVVAA